MNGFRTSGQLDVAVELNGESEGGSESLRWARRQKAHV